MRWPLAALLASLGCAHAPPAPAPAPAAAVTAPATPAWPEPAPPALRLPDTVRPTRYALALTLLPDAPTFPGTVTADVEVRAPVRQVWLHAQDLEVKAARVVLAGGRSLEARAVPGEGGLLGLLLPEEVPAGTAQVVVEFVGRVNAEKSEGVYMQAEGGERYLYTFFEPIDSRRAFPNFDEPSVKVPWRLTFTVRAVDHARANAPVEKEEPLPGGLKRVTFAESKPMPSYLVAFMVGPFDVVDGGTVGREKKPLHFLVPRGRGPETAYARKVTPRLVQVLEDFFDQPYPYEKLDVAVVPRYWGTMEHPGIVALGQPLTLIRPGEETVARRQRYVHIALHELGHYWFGDVVTCRWWDDVWLNESLTSWLDGHSVEAFEPAWGFKLEQGTLSRESAFAADALPSALPVRKPVESNDDIVGSFDNGTTYDKGSSVLRMLDGWLGEDVVRGVMRRYVREHAWQVAGMDDLLRAFADGTGRPEVARAFASFVTQPGVPRVSATLQCRPGEGPVLALAQERFVPAGVKAPPEATWSIPVCVRTATSHACTLLDAARGTLTLPQDTCPSWVLLDAGGSGYYRSGYTREQLAALLALPREALGTPERLGLLADVGGLVERGDVPLGEALEVVPATARDPSRLVLERGVRLLGRVHVEQLPGADRARFRAWMRALYGPRARALGWTPRPDEDDEKRKTRAVLMGRAALAGEDPALTREATRLARAWLADRKSVHPEVARLALGVAVRQGDRALFDALLARARATQDREERTMLLAQLGGFRAPALAREALALVASGEFDQREAVGILQGALQGAETRELAWAFYEQHFDALVARMRSDDAGNFISLARVHCSDAARREVQAFLTPRVRKVENGPSVLERTVEAIGLCAEQQRRNAPGVQAFLRVHAGSGPADDRARAR